MTEDTIYTYGTGLTGAELYMNKSRTPFPVMEFDIKDYYSVDVILTNEKFIELYPTLELAKTGATYWRHQNNGKAKLKRRR